MTYTRRLSGAGPNGGSAYLRADPRRNGVVSRLFDAAESDKVDGARTALAVALAVVEADKLDLDEAKMMLALICEHLEEVVIVADSRRERIAALTGEDADEDEDDASADD
ncbi:hypothetical protein ABZ722_33990 [Streptomyces longwoodensis]|uniref:hypothetical protein n=1 Tax=Streptomyces longwoodensis TaxID=68231 RepID=UPI0033F52249